MNNNSQILVPVDFSNASLKALDYATNIAQQINKKVTVVNIIKSPKSNNKGFKLPFASGWNAGSNGIDALFTHKLFRKNKKRLRALKLNWKNHHVINKTLIRFSSKEPLEEIKDLVGKYNPYMLVLPYAPHTYFEQYFSSNFTLDVLRNIKIPTLFVPKKTVVKKIENIVLPSGFSDEVNQDFLGVIKDVNGAFNSNLHLVKVLGNQEDKLHSDVKIIDFANRKSLTNYHVNSIVAEDVETALDIHIQSVKADLLCLMTKGKSGFSQLFYSNSMTETLLKITGKPVLSMSLKDTQYEMGNRTNKSNTDILLSELSY